MDAFSSSLAAAALVDGQQFSLPGLGSLEGIYIPAWINHVNREVDPPRLDVRWTSAPEAATQTFAELLISTGATRAEAEATQDKWLRALLSGDPVALGDLGTLQLDRLGGQVAWTASERGLATAYWSGGAVAVEPLDKRDLGQGSTTELYEGADASTAAAVAAGIMDDPTDAIVVQLDTAAKVASGKSAFPILKLLRYAAMFGLVVLTLALLRSAFADQLDEEETGQAVTVSQDRVNRSPLDEANAGPSISAVDEFEEPRYNEAFGPTGSNTVEPGVSLGSEPIARTPPAATTPPSGGLAPAAALPKRLPATAQRVDPADLASAAPSPRSPQSSAFGEREVIVILGSFGSNANAARLTEQIASKGLLPYLDQPANLTRVGVSFTATNQREIDDFLARMRREFNRGAWVL